MHYDKLTPERFREKIASNEYKGLPGARRAIGKADWSEGEKASARSFIDQYFSSPENSPEVEKKVAKPAASPPPAVRAKPVAKKAAAVGEKEDGDAKEEVRSTVRSVPPQAAIDSTSRYTAASAVVAAFKNVGSLSPIEQQTYALAQAEMHLHTSPAARGETAPAEAPVSNGKTVRELLIEAQSSPIPEDLAPEDRSAWERLQKAAETVTRTLTRD